MKYIILAILLLAACAPEIDLQVPEPIAVIEDPVLIDEPIFIEKQEEISLEPGLVATGSFTRRAISTRGDITITRQSDGSYILELLKFEHNKPENTQIILTQKRQIVSSQDLAFYYVVDDLKGDIKHQFYIIPKEVPVEKYGSVTLLEKSNSVVQGSAILEFVLSPNI